MIRQALFLLFAFCCGFSNAQDRKINGMSIVGERSKITKTQLSEVPKQSASNWIALTPYSFCSVDNPSLKYDQNWQWAGECTDGILAGIIAAKDLNLKIMIKPHIWVKEQGWAGDLSYSEKNWLIWESAYRNYILNYARLADSLSVDMLCVGTEVRKSASQRAEFWQQLIIEVREIYAGKVTYAANWDNYENISFWEDLDLIGIDAYFPLDSNKHVDFTLLSEKTDSLSKEIAQFSKKYDKQVLFTEFGFRSVDYAAWRDWELPSEYENPVLGFNALNQVYAYRSFLKTFWKQDYVAGGFVWKWHPSLEGPLETNDFTPQGKPALQVIKLWYEAL
jgi:hypothetical protein